MKRLDTHKETDPVGGEKGIRSYFVVKFDFVVQQCMMGHLREGGLM